MVAYPKDPAEQVARVIKDHKKRLIRIEARLDQAGSSRSKERPDISTAKTNITAAQTAITAVNTGSGGTTQENFLGNLSQVTAVSPTNGGGWTSGGRSSEARQIDTSVLTGWMNQVHADIAALAAALHSRN